MADLTSYLLETDRPRGVNLLIKTYDRNATAQVLRRYLDVQVDHRDPNGRQADPHLTSIQARDGQGRLRQNHAAAYGHPDFDTIEHYAGDNRQPILNERGEQIGTVYAVKAELVPSPHGDGGHFINVSTLEPSDFEVNRTTMTRQVLSARLVRQEQAEDASVIFEEEPSASVQHENTRTERTKAVPRADDGIYRGAPTPAGISSQAGLGATYGPRNAVPASPPPGTPGSRFNPVVKGRHPEASIPKSPDPRMISSMDALKPNAKKLRAPTAQEISSLGRISQAAAEGAREGARIGRTIPKVGPVIGGVVGGVVGAGQGAVREADAKQVASAAAPASTAAQPSDPFAEAEIVGEDSPANPFAAAGARFGAPAAMVGTSAPPKLSVKDSYAYQYEDATKGADSPQLE